MEDPFRDLEASTGRTAEQWFAVLDATGFEKHGDLMKVLKGEHALSHGFANGIVLMYRSRGASTTDADLVDAQYSGAKAALRPIYDRLVEAARALGPDVEIAPKKTGVSLRRSKQFAVIEVPSAKRIQLGLQLKGDPFTQRLVAGNAMCSHRVDLAAATDVDAQLLGWLTEAYSRA